MKKVVCSFWAGGVRLLAHFGKHLAVGSTKRLVGFLFHSTLSNIRKDKKRAKPYSSLNRRSGSRTNPKDTSKAIIQALMESVHP